MFKVREFLNIRDFIWDYPENIKKYSPISYILIGIIIVILLIFLFFKYNFISLKPFSNNTYTEGIVSSSTYYNPYSSSRNLTFVKDVNSLIFSHLVYIKSNGNIDGIVAKSWRIENNSTKYIFYLRKNFLFQNGRDVNAYDVCYSFYFYKKYFPSSVLSNITCITVSKYKVEFLLKNLDVKFFQDINFNIVPQGSNYIKNISNIVGSGEYRINYLTNSQIEFIRFNNYYFGKAHFKYFIFKIFPGYNKILSAIENDKLDGAYFPNYININTNKYPNIVLHQKPLGNYYTAIFFNLTKITDINLRNALSYSISKKYITENILKGTATPMYTPIAQNSWEYSSAKDINHYNFNSKKAADLLKGNLYNINVYYLNSTPLSVIDYIKKSWNNIGVSAVFLPEDSSQISDIISKGEYDIVLNTIKSSINSNNISLWYSKSNENISKLSNNQIDQLLLVGISTINEKDRKETYALFQKDIQNINPAIFLYSNNFLYISNKNIKGINFSNISYPHQRFYFIYKWYLS